ncbi:diguanylate cyclase [Sulfuricurvum sp.]|uniref:diguanylate cyclase n=1 Tax=Sulfuricurvum sp. TaxID=2025608 RepID=UPI00262EED02|nr:diguanylate cyclase [Sulfuricurvum sp.]MDD2780959.1 diguanylate cyclase [Sulfuricurvum sp.]
MSLKNKNIILFFSLLLIAGYVIIGMALYEYTHKYAEDQNKKKLDQLLLNQEALHSYLEDHLKPVIYKLKEENKLYSDFFDPKVLSFTYIARGIHQQLNVLRDEHNITRIYYKLATDNPRNTLNSASADERNLLQYFRMNPDVKEYSSIVQENNHNYIYYAMPIKPNKDSCMKCHSTPDKAPTELIEQYGDKAGFGEKVGNIRAIISLKMPFDDELAEANRIFYLIMGMLTLFLLSLFGIVLFFMRRLDHKQQIIEEKNKNLSILAERDGLTNVYNRRSFDTDLVDRINNPALTLIIFDIDFFKNINDTYGHQVGDNILISLTSLIRSNLREEDHLYRIGGEEFAILTFKENSEDAEQLVARVMQKVSIHDFKISQHIHISAGIAQRSGTDSALDLFKRADDALYRAKEEGRNCYRVG